MITVRPAQPTDAETIARMARALSLTDGGRPSRFTAESFRRDGFGDDAAFSTLVAEFSGDIAGYAVYYPGYDTDSATRGVYLADLYVDEAHRRKGLGRALLSGLAAEARRNGARWMFWSVLKRNRGARRFYRKMAPELKDVIVCAAFGRRFDALADQAR
jgi:GNAT superfamily N-acetyltransferase